MTGSTKESQASLDEKLIHGVHSDAQPAALVDPGPCDATLHVPYQEWYSAKSKYYPPALLDISGESTPVNFMSNMAHVNATDIFKRSIPVQIITRLIDSSPSLRGMPITFQYPERNGMTLRDKQAEIARTEKQASGIAFDLLRIRLLETTMSKTRDKWNIIQSVLPPVSTRDTGWEYCCSLVNNVISRVLIGFEYDLRVIGGALMQPMRHLRVGRIFEIKNEDSTGTQVVKRIGQVSFGLLIALPLAIIAQPFFLIGNIFASLQGFADGVCTLLGCAWNKKENKKAIIWTSLKTIFKSLVQLVPTVIAIVLYFTPAAPAVAAFMTANSLGVNLSLSVILGSAYSFVSCAITGTFDYLATKLMRFLDTLAPKKLSSSLPPSPVLVPNPATAIVADHDDLLAHDDARRMRINTVKNTSNLPPILDDPFNLNDSSGDLPISNDGFQEYRPEKQPEQPRSESIFEKESPYTSGSTAFIGSYYSENIHQDPPPGPSRDSTSTSTSTTNSSEASSDTRQSPLPQPILPDSGHTSPTKDQTNPYLKLVEGLFNKPAPTLHSTDPKPSQCMSH